MIIAVVIAVAIGVAIGVVLVAEDSCESMRMDGW